MEKSKSNDLIELARTQIESIEYEGHEHGNLQYGVMQAMTTILQIIENQQEEIAKLKITLAQVEQHAVSGR